MADETTRRRDRDRRLGRSDDGLTGDVPTRGSRDGGFDATQEPAIAEGRPARSR